jgi:hypothetical protein
MGGPDAACGSCVAASAPAPIPDGSDVGQDQGLHDALDVDGWDDGTVARLASALVAVAVLAGGVIYLAHRTSLPSSCGLFLTAKWSGKYFALDGCDGELIPPREGVTVSVGERVTFDGDHHWSGFFSTNPTILVTSRPGTHVAAFRAVAPGSAVIQVKTDRWCASRVSKTTCDALTVTVST